MPNLGPTELVVILVIALLVFGPKRLPDLGRSVGRGLREFKKARDEVTGAIKLDASDLDPNTPLPAAKPSTAATPVPAAVSPAQVGEAKSAASEGAAADAAVASEGGDPSAAAASANGDSSAAADAAVASAIGDVTSGGAAVRADAEPPLEDPVVPDAGAAPDAHRAPDATTAPDGEDEVLHGEVVDDEPQPQSGSLDPSSGRHDADPA